MPYTEREDGDFFPLLLSDITVIIFILLIPKSQELIHWFVLLVFRIRVSKYDVDYGVILYSP